MMVLLREPHRDGEVDPPRREISIGGPRFWLALAAAVGTGLFCWPATNYIVALLRLPPFPEIVGYGGWLSEGVRYVPFAAGVLLLCAAGAWFLGTWCLVRVACGSGPEFRQATLLTVLVFVGSISWILFFLFFITPVQRFSLDEDRGTGLLLYVGMWFVTYFVPSVVFGTIRPRHGFFYAAVATVATADLIAVDEPEFGTYLVTARMAFIFLYVSMGRFAQWPIALFGIIAGWLGLPGAVLGTIFWRMRKDMNEAEISSHREKSDRMSG